MYKINSIDFISVYADVAMFVGGINDSIIVSALNSLQVVNPSYTGFFRMDHDFQKKLAAVMGISEVKISRAFNSAAKRGFITLEKRNKNGEVDPKGRITWAKSNISHGEGLFFKLNLDKKAAIMPVTADKNTKKFDTQMSEWRRSTLINSLYGIDLFTYQVIQTCTSGVFSSYNKKNKKNKRYSCVHGITELQKYIPADRDTIAKSVKRLVEKHLVWETFVQVSEFKTQINLTTAPASAFTTSYLEEHGLLESVNESIAMCYSPKFDAAKLTTVESHRKISEENARNTINSMIYSFTGEYPVGVNLNHIAVGSYDDCNIIKDHISALFEPSFTEDVKFGMSNLGKLAILLFCRDANSFSHAHLIDNMCKYKQEQGHAYGVKTKGLIAMLYYKLSESESNILESHIYRLNNKLGTNFSMGAYLGGEDCCTKAYNSKVINA